MRATAYTDYCDDQAWTARLGQRDEAAIAFQTQYGGRAGLVSLVPMWRIGERMVYQAQAYAEPTYILTHALRQIWYKIKAAPSGRPGARGALLGDGIARVRRRIQLDQ